MIERPGWPSAGSVLMTLAGTFGFVHVVFAADALSFGNGMHQHMEWGAS